MGTTRKEVARAAIQLETDGREMYLDMAKKSPNPETRKMFESLALDEADHIQWIKDVEPGVDVAETANRRLYARLRHIFADVPEASLRKIAASQGDVDAINFAIGIENKSIDAYEKWANEAENEEIRALCSVLVDVEHFHRQVLSNTLEYLEHSPDWFMQEEQWNFEGA